MSVYRTKLASAQPHWTGWVPFGDGLEITAAPLIDADHDGLFARLTYSEAVAVAGAMGARLLTLAEHDDLWRFGRRLRPVIKSPGPEMASIAYAQQHDAELTDQLQSWDGKAPLANAGKQWVGGAAPGRALNYGWWDFKAPNGRMWQTLGHAHDDQHTDYSQLTMLVRPRRAAADTDRPIEAADLSAIIAPFSPLADVARTAASWLGGHELPPPVPSNPGGHFLPSKEDLMFDVTKFVQAKNFRVANRPAASVLWLVIHSMEAAEKPSTAENVAAWFAGPNAPMASAHYCLDADSTVQCVALKDVAFAAPGSNAEGIHIELAGYAKQSAAEWDDVYSRAMLERLASLLAGLSELYAIPLAYVDANGLKVRQKGVTTHADVTKAFRKTDHMDPGKGFPMGKVLAMAMAARAAG